MCLLPSGPRVLWQDLAHFVQGACPPLASEPAKCCFFLSSLLPLSASFLSWLGVFLVRFGSFGFRVGFLCFGAVLVVAVWPGLLLLGLVVLSFLPLSFSPCLSPFSLFPLSCLYFIAWPRVQVTPPRPLFGVVGVFVLVGLCLFWVFPLPRWVQPALCQFVGRVPSAERPQQLQH